MKSISICCFILMSYLVSAQSNLAFQYNSLKNIPVNSISAINGNEILAATEKGLYKITDFETGPRGLSDAAVLKMDYDANNQIWLGLYSNQITSVRNEKYDIGIPKTDIINVLTIINNTIWVGTNNGVYSFSLTKMKEMPHYTSRNSKLVGNQVNAIVADPTGKVWIGTNRGLSIFDGKRWESYQKEKQITAIERNGNDMWIAAGKNIFQFDNNQNWKSISLPINYAFHIIRDLAFDYNGDLWIASQHVLRYERLSKTFFVYDTNTGFTSNMALCLAIDKDNQVWVGTAGKGIFRIKNEIIEKPLAIESEPEPQTVVINQPPSKPEYGDITSNESSNENGSEPEIIIKNNPKKPANTIEKSKPKRKRFSVFNNSEDENIASENTEKSGFVTNRKAKKVKSSKNEKANINFLGSRLIKDGVEVEIEEMQIEIAIWDGQNMDGDSVSLYYNGMCILKNYNLTKERQYFKLDINPRVENSLILYAHTNGELGYSTATIAIEGQDTDTKWIVLNSDVKKCDRIIFKFVY